MTRWPNTPAVAAAAATTTDASNSTPGASTPATAHTLDVTAPTSSSSPRWRWRQLLLLCVVAAAAVVPLRPVVAVCVGAAGYGNETAVDLYPELVPAHKTALVIGYLTAIKGELKDRQGLSISGALTMALDQVSGRGREGGRT